MAALLVVRISAEGFLRLFCFFVLILDLCHSRIHARTSTGEVRIHAGFDRLTLSELFNLAGREERERAAEASEYSIEGGDQLVHGVLVGVEVGA